MRVRYKKNLSEGHSGQFNLCGLGEVLLEDTSEYISELDVYLEKSDKWKDMRQAFKDKDLIIDNYNTCFFEPANQEDKNRGYALG